MTKPRFSSIEDYLTSVGPAKGDTICTIIDYILAQFPELESKVAWNVPTIHRNGKYVFGISAAKNHLTFSAWSPQIIADFHDRLTKYVVLKNCFQIPVDWKIEKKLVKDLIRARLAELDAE